MRVLLLILAINFGYAQEQRKLIWSDEFDGAQLDSKSWNVEIGDGCPNCGWGNAERQLYTDENHRVSGGMLTITAKKEGEKYSSARISTKGKREFRYGRFEARAKLPVGHGIWPAFWMLGSNISKVGWPKCGEIDILEYVGREPDMVFTSLHTQDSHGNTVNTKKSRFENIEEGFHVFAAEWTKEKIDFYVDEKLVYTFNPKDRSEDVWPFDQPFYLLVNMAIGGNFGGPDVDDSIFPQEFVIDYIRVYQ
ncbi:MAG: glycoside hydrolase family 16 protein [Flavobacterium sp.]|nr:glycoside hydrolase family 16 protein [Flavobacterium sp.]